MKFVQIEYDLTYTGGDYSRVGEFALIPQQLCDELGVEVAFERITGHSPLHIIHYSEDDLYDAEGNLLE